VGKHFVEIDLTESEPFKQALAKGLAELEASFELKLEGKIEETAGQLYTKYCEAVGGVAFNGDPLPAWDEFSKDPAKEKQSKAWIAAATELFPQAQKPTEEEVKETTDSGKKKKK
jgi:hypothetical protein